MTVEYIMPPLTTKAAYLMADLAELSLLFKQVDTVSQATLHSILAEQIGKPVDDEAGNSSYEEIENKLAPPGASSSADKRDAQNLLITDAIRQFSYRQEAFGDAYPFVLKDGVLELASPMRKQHALYIFLLLCAWLKAFKSKSLRTKCASIFEDVCKVALEGMFPTPAYIKRFGHGSSDRKDHFGKSFANALNVLTSNIHAEPGPGFYSAGKSGDGGLDIVGSVIFGTKDEAHSAFSAFGQCATGEDWDAKIYESAHVKWGNWISFWHPPANMIFIPHCFRDSNGQWFNRKGFGAIVVDRVRINHFAKSTLDKSALDILTNRKSGFGFHIQ